MKRPGINRLLYKATLFGLAALLAVWAVNTIIHGGIQNVISTFGG